MLNQDYKDILSIFLEEKIEFLLIGAYALAVHGLPRATGDIDLFVRPSKENAFKVYKALARFGAPLKGITPDDFSTLGTFFQIGIAPRRIDIINQIDGITFESADEDKTFVEIEGLKVPVISQTKLILNKEAAGRDKDKIDVKMLKKRKN